MALFAQAAPAAAERPLELGVTGYTDTLFSDPDPAVHDLWLDRSADAGAEMVVLAGFWSQIAPASPPADPTDPSDPGYSWSTLDAGVRNASAHGFEVMIIVTQAPDWAEGPNRPPVSDTFRQGSWKPDPAAFGRFARAITTRYSGEYVDPSDPLAGPLPAVRLWEVWAEPNLYINLNPQYENGTQFSAGHYRTLLNEFYSAANEVDPRNEIVTGGLAPYGDEPGGRRTRPLTFFRKLLCLRDRQRLRPVKCPQKASFDVLGHNPINLSGGARRSAIDPDDASSADLEDVARTLKAAERAKTIRPRGKHELWATEFWWNSNPPHPRTSPPKEQARWIEEALYLFWKAGARVAINLKIRDANDRESQVEGTGLYFFDGTPKPALTAFRFPFVTERRSKAELFAWGKAPLAGKLRIEELRGGGWRPIAAQRVRAGDVFTKRLEVAGAAKLRARIGGQTSLVWSQRR